MKAEVLNEIKSISVNLTKRFNVYYGIDIVTQFPDYLKKIKYDKAYFISEEVIFNLHGAKFIDVIKHSGIDCEVILISGTEENKNFAALEKLCCTLVKKKVSKDSILIGFGGGLVGNITGLAAALIYRGIRFIEVSTTLMGQSDSTLSNKQAINGDTGKNQFGTFHAPEFIWADLKYLETETRRHIMAAIVEGIKNAFISDKSLLNDIETILSHKDKMTINDIFHLFEIMIISKNKILADDPTEKKYAVILEYGHTFGHAIEFLTKGNIIHGEAVGIGMCIAAELGHIINAVSKTSLEQHYYFIRDLADINLKLPEDITPEKIFNTIQNDNKRVSSGIKYIILDEIGKCLNGEGDYQVTISKEKVIQAINNFKNKTQGMGI